MDADAVRRKEHLPLPGERAVGGEPVRKGYLYLLDAWEWFALPNARLLIRSDADFTHYPALQERLAHLSNVEILPHVVFTSPFRDEHFLRGAPVITVDSWRGLPKLLRRYARDIDTLERYRLASLAWWNDHCSEPVIARQLATQLNCSREAV
jgi:hypothetical protein